MTRAETRAFLLQGTRTGKLATTRADGRPHVTPIWFVLDIPSLSPSQGSGFAATVGKAAVAAGDDVVWTTGATSLKAKAIRRDARVCMCVDDQAPPYSYVMIEGSARCPTIWMRCGDGQPSSAAATWARNVPRSSGPGTPCPGSCSCA